MSRLAAAIISYNQTQQNRVSCYQTSGAVFPKQFCYYDLYVSSALSSVVFILLWEERKWQLFRPSPFVVFVFYGPSTLSRSIRARSVTLSTLFMGKPPRQFTSTYFTFFRQKLTPTCILLESAEGREWPYKLMHDQSPQKNVAGREDRTRDRPHIRRTCIRTSYRTRLSLFVTIFCGFIFVLFVLCGKDKFCIIPGSICVCFSDTHSRRK